MKESGSKKKLVQDDPTRKHPRRQFSDCHTTLGVWLQGEKGAEESVLGGKVRKVKLTRLIGHGNKEEENGD